MCFEFSFLFQVSFSVCYMVFCKLSFSFQYLRLKTTAPIYKLVLFNCQYKSNCVNLVTALSLISLFLFGLLSIH